MTIDLLKNTVVELFDNWAKRTPNVTAVEWNGDKLTYADLRDASLHVSRALLAAGARPGDRIPILSQMSLQLLPSMLGVLRVGACYVAIDLAVWSHARIEATLHDVSPRLAIVTKQTTTHNLPTTVSFQESWLKSPFDHTDNTRSQLDCIRRSCDAKSLAYVTFTSGTTGKPKGVMIYHHALYEFASLTTEITPNIGSGERVLLAFSISFDACAATIYLTITRGGTLVMASWSTFPEVATTCDTLILSPSMFASLDPAGLYERVRKIFLGGEAVNLDVARQWITPTRKVVHTYGPTEATMVISWGRIFEHSTSDLGTLSPGVEVHLVDDDLHETDLGEILIGGPCLAAGYLNQPELTATKFINWNGKHVYRTGDLARRTDSGLSWVGRADRVVKNRGFLVNLETDVESGMLRFPGVRAASAFMWRGKLMGFVQPATVNREEMRLFMKKTFDQFIVPDEILALDQFPLTAHAKIDRAALLAQLEKRMAQEDSELENLVCTSPYDALRWAFARCLQVPFSGLDRSSSFSQLGGNSLAAIRLLKFLNQQSYTIPILHVIRGDIIQDLEARLVKIDGLYGVHKPNGPVQADSELVLATDLHRVMLTESQKNPLTNCLLARAKFVGPQDATPTPNELHAAWKATLAVHSIFTTRYDLQDWTLHDLGRINLDWEEVCVEADDFDKALLSTQQKLWAHQNSLERLDNTSLEVPFSHMTCVYSPNRKAIGFVWRIHHVLIDIFSSIILIRDLEQARAGETLTRGPHIKDYARFMQKFKNENLGRAIELWNDMLQPLTRQSLFEFRTPQAVFEGEAWTTLSLKTAETVDSLEAVASIYNVSAATFIFAAWALVLSKYTRSDAVPFYLSLSGRMIHWPPAASLVAATNCRVPFVTQLPAESTVQEWLAHMHNALLAVAELENLSQSLEKSDYNVEYFNTCVQAFLYMPEEPPSWEFHDQPTGRPKPIEMVWRVQPVDDGSIQADLEINHAVVDLEWGKEVSRVASNMLEGLIKAERSTNLQDLTQILFSSV